jgi:hypothetical protein
MSKLKSACRADDRSILSIAAALRWLDQRPIPALSQTVKSAEMRGSLCGIGGAGRQVANFVGSSAGSVRTHHTRLIEVICKADYTEANPSDGNEENQRFHDLFDETVRLPHGADSFNKTVGALARTVESQADLLLRLKLSR